MSEAPEREPFRLDAAVVQLLTRLRIPLLVLLAVIGISLIAILIVTDRRRALDEKSTELIEEIEIRWVNATSEELVSLDKEVLPQLQLLADRHSRRYAGRRALQLLALRHAQLEEWQEAADRFLELAERSDGYLAALALSNAAVAYEEIGDREAASNNYTEVVSRFPDEAIVTPRALFSLARLEEEQGDEAKASDLYARLEERYPGSRWSVLARNRLIYLRAAGALEGN